MAKSKLIRLNVYIKLKIIIMEQNYAILSVELIFDQSTTYSRIIGAVRGTHSQLWETIISVCSPYAPRKFD